MDVLNRKPGSLSGGQLQRAAIALALAMEPSLLLLDEPLSHLDRPLAEELRGVLRRLHRDYGITIVHVTHDQDEALALATRIAIMRSGKIIAFGEAPTIYYRPPSPEAARFLGHNLVDAHLLGQGEGVIAIPPEAIELGSGEYEATIASVEVERGRYTMRLLVNNTVELRAYVHPLRAKRLRPGTKTRFNIDWSLTITYPAETK
ncbi:putative ABC transporter [Hyperthermus butylicus DSM 5456]|uniref:Molybdate/tungstate import ATP-binding protein WtpC n=2 Tax=Hyperthermus butylicus TaxID=54248 RepID=A2BL04_HYPBU|nr:putative ABC transporter [Hyperthermus butylicus DSM 5456]